MPTFSDFDDDFPTATAPPVGDKFDLKKLPDGSYTFEVTSAESKDTKAGPLVAIKLVLLDGGIYAGAKVEKTYFLTQKGEDGGDRVKDPRQIAELRKDLETLGFDVPNWTPANGRPFSQQLIHACRVMVGVRFVGKKKTGGTGYANLYINERAEGDGKPAAFGPAEMAPPEDPFAV